MILHSASKAATYLPHKAKASHCPVCCLTASREAVNTDVLSVSLDQTRNRTPVYRFIHSTPDC